jgi:DNA-binding NarL/FixJ family response regulator
MPLRVLVVERSALVRAGLRRVLEDEPDIVVASDVPTVHMAIGALSRDEMDVVVVSTAVDRDAIRSSAIASLRAAADVKVLCISHWSESREIDAAFSAGAAGCVEVLDATDADLKMAVCLVGSGERYLSQGLLNAGVLSDQGWAADHERLTAREKEILVLIAQSKSNREIARQLNLSANTIAVHRNHLMKKIGVRKATALALFAAERGLLARK